MTASSSERSSQCAGWINDDNVKPIALLHPLQQQLLCFSFIKTSVADTADPRVFARILHGFRNNLNTAHLGCLRSQLSQSSPCRNMHLQQAPCHSAPQLLLPNCKVSQFAPDSAGKKHSATAQASAHSAFSPAYAEVAISAALYTGRTLTWLKALPIPIKLFKH